MRTSFWRALKVFSVGPPDSCRMESLDQWVPASDTRKDECRKQLWAENIQINSQVVWTFDAVLCSKLHLELSIISTTMKIKLLWTLKEKGSWPKSRLASGLSRCISEYICSSQFLPDNKSRLALRTPPCVTECEKRLVQWKGQLLSLSQDGNQ